MNKIQFLGRNKINLHWTWRARPYKENNAKKKKRTNKRKKSMRTRKDFATFASFDLPRRSLLESSRAKGHRNAKNGKGKDEAELES